VSSRARKAQRLSQHDPSDSPKHGRTASGNEEYSLQRDTGDDADSVIDGVGQNSNQDFRAIGVAELLRLDPRPTFVVDADLDEGLEHVFLNEALRADDHLVRARSTQGRCQHATKSIQRV
jgi:hypothetical protein